MENCTVEVALELDMSLGESPLWSVERQMLYWVDINNGCLYSWRPTSDEKPSVIELDEKVGCIALCENGLLAATASGIERLEFPLGNQRERVADNLEWHQSGNRFNDGRCDAAGRFWVGTIAADEASPTAGLYCLDQGDFVCRQSSLSISNGLAFSPDKRWLYHTDSLTRQILRYPFDVETGATGEPENWVDLEALGLPGVPDGAAIDSEGHYWSALYGGGRIVRFSPQGELMANIELPCPHPTMVAFGGPDLQSLYITTATQHLDAEGKERWPAAGSLLRTQVPIAGLREPTAITVLKCSR
ncbi:SMP-30/gluconolactonase/LRE family protein [Vreelandella arcis]|nr:SMP-30/gluconolactonase/LRE family protein [Halomonas arcis]